MNESVKRLEETASESQFQGVVSLRDRGNIICEKGFGYRDLANRLPNEADTAFGLASGTKSFTAAGIGTLIDRGELAFDTTMGEIFGSTTSYIAPEATVDQLLCHTSGVYDYLDEEIITDFDNFRVEIPWSLLETPTDYLPLFEGQKPKFTPGEQFSYSNGGYVLLGVIIERISGMLYRDYLANYVLNPAGMDRSGFFAFNELPSNTALGYIEKEGRPVSNIYALPVRGGGDGGMYSTAGDIARFWEILLRGDLLRRETADRLLSPCRQPYKTWNYARGFYLPENGRGDVIKMSGCDGGVGFFSCCDRRKDRIYTVMSNRTNGQSPFHSLLPDILGT